MLSQEAERKPFHVVKWFPSNLTARAVHSGAQRAVVYHMTMSLLRTDLLLGGPSMFSATNEIFYTILGQFFPTPRSLYIHTIHHNITY
jgi:hypothetical protein